MRKGNPKFAKKAPVPKVSPLPIHRVLEIEQMDAMAKAVDEKGRQMDAKWGHGRLPLLCGSEWAGKFAAQCVKFRDAYAQQSLADVVKYADWMERAYAKLDEVATQLGHKPVPPEQWEFEVDGSLVILVRDMNRMNQVDTGGRACQVWSLDEIANVIRMHPILASAKDAFPGAEIIETRPAKRAMSELNDSTEGLDEVLGWS